MSNQDYIKKEQLTEILVGCLKKKYKGKGNSSPDYASYFQGSIPSKKLKNALAAYAGNVSPEDVIMLFDYTMLGSGKSGFLFTTRLFAASSEIAGKKNPNLIFYDEIASVTGPGNGYRFKIRLKDGACIEYDGINFRHFLSDVLKQILTAHEESPAENCEEIPEAEDSGAICGALAFLNEFADMSPQMMERLYKRGDVEAGMALAFWELDEDPAYALQIFKDLAEIDGLSAAVLGLSIVGGEIFPELKPTDAVPYLKKCADHNAETAFTLSALYAEYHEQLDPDYSNCLYYLEKAKSNFDSAEKLIFMDDLEHDMKDFEEQLRELGVYKPDEISDDSDDLHIKAELCDDAETGMLEGLYKRGDMEGVLDIVIKANTRRTLVRID